MLARIVSATKAPNRWVTYWKATRKRRISFVKDPLATSFSHFPAGLGGNSLRCSFPTKLKNRFLWICGKIARYGRDVTVELVKAAIPKGPFVGAPFRIGGLGPKRVPLRSTADQNIICE